MKQENLEPFTHQLNIVQNLPSPEERRMTKQNFAWKIFPKFTEIYTSMQCAVDDRKGAGHLHILASLDEVSW